MAKKVKARSGGRPILKGERGLQALFYIQHRHYDFLKARSDKSGQSMSCLLRKALDAHYGLSDAKAKDATAGGK